MKDNLDHIASYSGVGKDICKNAIEQGVLIDTLESRQVNDGITHSTTVWNNTKHKDLILVYRDNMKIPMKSKIDNSYRGVVIKNSYTMPYKDLETAHDYMVCREDSGPRNNYWEELVSTVASKVGYHRNKISKPYMITISIFKFISEVELTKAENIYLSNEDVSISRGDISEVLDHPYSYANSAKEHYWSNIDDEVSLTVTVDLVDNKGVVGSKWIMVGGTAVKIPTRKSNNREEGLHITTKTSNDDAVSVKYYDAKDVLKTLIWNSEEDALTNGTPELLLNKETEREKVNLIIQKKELEDAKKEALADKIKLEERYRSSDHDRDRDIKSRSGVLDFIKLSGVVLTAGLGGLTAYNRYKGA